MTNEIPFNTLDHVYDSYKEELVEATLRVLGSSWYILGKEVLALKRRLPPFAIHNTVLDLTLVWML